VRQAIARFRREPGKADISFFVADASRFPLIDNSFDYVLIYGVLHHLPDVGFACREVARTLKPGGIYFGLENNETILRKVFDFWQKLKPLWHEEAGPQALMGRNRFSVWFDGTNMDLDMHCSVFVPPELVNFLGNRAGRWMLRATDRIARSVRTLKDQGGLIVIRGQKRDISTL
jgi:SAM-dependent methyltransferase